MARSKIRLVLALSLTALFTIGCGDDKDPRLSNQDVAYLKEKRLKEIYGGSATSTATTTSTTTVTIRNTTN